MYMKILSTFLFLIIIHEKGECQSDALDKRISEIEGNVNYLADEAEKLYVHRESEVNECKNHCTVHACANDLHSTDMKICGYVERYYCDDNLDDGIYNYCIGEYRDPGGTIIKLPPDVLPNELSAATKESICTFRKMEDKFRETLDIYVDKSVMVASITGTFRKWPRHAYPRFEDGQPDYNNCDRYDPRSRPWFIGAISGPKDIVIMIDRSVIMLKAWSDMKNIVKDILNTLYIYDYVNIVLFSDDVEVLGNGYSFLSVNQENIDDLKIKIDNADTGGGDADFEKAFGTAFDLFVDSKASCSSTDSYDVCMSSQCTRTIILISGSEPKENINDTLNYVKKEQDSISPNETSVAIHTINIGETLGGSSLLRQLSCANIGSWTHIKVGDDVKYQLATMLSFNSISKVSNDPVWIADYKDWTGLGSVTSVAKVITSDAGYVVGVVSQSVPVAELAIETGISEYAVLNDLVGKSSKCINRETIDQCQLQVFRVIEDSVCVASTPKSKCYQYRNEDLYYQVFESTKSRDDAQATCQEKGGNLVTIRNIEDHMSFIASISSTDGSWLGAYYITNSANDEFSWSDDTVDSIDNSYSGWAHGEADKEIDNLNQCVLIDRRGTTGNMYLSNCSDKKGFICEFKEIPVDCSTDEIYVYDEKNDFKIPPLKKCDGEGTDSLQHKIDSLKPVDASYSLLYNDIMCDIGNDASFDTMTCCDYEAKECPNGPITPDVSENDKVYMILFIVFLILFVLCFICFCITFSIVYKSYLYKKYFSKYKKTPSPAADDKESQENI